MNHYDEQRMAAAERMNHIRRLNERKDELLSVLDGDTDKLFRLFKKALDTATSKEALIDNLDTIIYEEREARFPEDKIPQTSSNQMILDAMEIAGGYIHHISKNVKRSSSPEAGRDYYGF